MRLRLLVGATAAIFVALTVAWFVMTFIFTHHIERRMEIDLRRDATQLVAAISQSADGRFDVADPPRDKRFDTPASGLYWQVSTPRQVVRSRSLWDQEIDRDSPAGFSGWRLRPEHGPFERKIFIVERRVRPGPAGAPAILIQVAQNAHGVHEARAEFGRELGVFLLLLWIVLSLAAWFQVHIGLRSLGKLRAEVVALKRRPDERLSSHYPREIAPLIEAINGLADAREADVRRARQRSADLAHAMKTPIAAMSAQSRRVAEGGGVTTEGLDRAIASIAAAVEAELARARAAAGRQSAGAATAHPASAVRGLIAVLERTEKGMRTDFIADIDESLRLRLDEGDLTEIIGALLENACRFARRQVLITGRIVGDGGAVVIEDDGPGMTDEDISRVMGRGVRLDERSGGHGLGLSIAGDLVEATGGMLTLGRAAIGGLRAELSWSD